MKNLNKNLITLAVISSFGLAACGGGGGSDTSPNSNNNQAASSSTVTGVITGFGSIFVDGVKYETDTSSFTVDDNASSEDQLAVGMVVTLTGTVNADGTTGVANSVTFSNELEGVVIANSFLADGTLNIMGQNIITSTETVFESQVPTITSIDQIATGNIVEVSGYSSGVGDIHATRLEVKKAAQEVSDEIEVKGLVSNLNEVAQTFTLGNLSVDYSSATLEDISTLTNNLYVEIKSTQALSGSTLVASKVELEGDGSKDKSGDDGEEMEFEGIISSVGDNSSFVINGQTVHFDTTTEFEYGALENLVANAKIKVEGEFNADGQLVAQEIKFKVSGDTELEGEVGAIDLENNTVSLMGQTFHINNHTIMDDERNEGVDEVRQFDIADLATSDWVEVKFYKDDQDRLIATKFERDDPDEQWSIEGKIQTLDNDNSVITIAGVDIDFSSLNITLTLNVGDEIEVEGSYANNTFSAIELELDD